MIELVVLKKPHKRRGVYSNAQDYISTEKFDYLKIPKPVRHREGQIEGDELKEKLAQARRNREPVGGFLF